LLEKDCDCGVDPEKFIGKVFAPDIAALIVSADQETIKINEKTYFSALLVYDDGSKEDITGTGEVKWSHGNPFTGTRAGHFVISAYYKGIIGKTKVTVVSEEKGSKAGTSRQPSGETATGGNIADRFAKRERDRSDYRIGREVADASRPVTPQQPPDGARPSEPLTSTPPTTGGTGPTPPPTPPAPTGGTTPTLTTPSPSGAGTPQPTSTTSTTASTGSATAMVDESKWYVWYTGAPGVWCKLTMSKDTKEYLEKRKGTVVVGPCNSEKEALQVLCGKMSDIFYVGGAAAVYPGVKAKVGGNVFDVGGFTYYDNNAKKYRCREK
jgi:hypothetical protein